MSLFCLDESYRRQTLRDHQKAKDVSLFEAPLLIRHMIDGCPIAIMEVPWQSSLANKKISSVLRDFSFMAVVKSVMSFTATFER